VVLSGTLVRVWSHGANLNSFGNLKALINNRDLETLEIVGSGFEECTSIMEELTVDHFRRLIFLNPWAFGLRSDCDALTRTTPPEY
jgi:hypothetical protein